jgi:hypothetical protein
MVSIESHLALGFRTTQKYEEDELLGNHYSIIFFPLHKVNGTVNTHKRHVMKNIAYQVEASTIRCTILTSVTSTPTSYLK